MTTKPLEEYVAASLVRVGRLGTQVLRTGATLKAECKMEGSRARTLPKNFVTYCLHPHIHQARGQRCTADKVKRRTFGTRKKEYEHLCSLEAAVA